MSSRTCNYLVCAVVLVALIGCSKRQGQEASSIADLTKAIESNVGSVEAYLNRAKPLSNRNFGNKLPLILPKRLM